MATTTAKTAGPEVRPAPASLPQADRAPCGRGADHRRLRLAGVRGGRHRAGQPRVHRPLRDPLNYLDVAAQVGIVGTAVALLMIAGEFDLSIGSLVGAGIVIGIGVTITGLPCRAMSMVATTLLGVLRGLIVVRTGLPSFIVTLATLFIIRGFSSVLTSVVTNITYIPIVVHVVATGPVAGIQLELPGRRWRGLQGLDAVVAPHRGRRDYVLGRTRFGNWIAGAGGSAAAARNLGVPVARVKISLFALTAFSASIPRRSRA